ncbi:HNH endonuclease [Bacillus coahuilensis]|uniref:HNH endonuclease n=1 Tax=Bacillus coahuilensis TaxID=408580 RepID=UPI0009EB3123|nr:HNH endonuclease [Bacillus coahuilensis]
MSFFRTVGKGVGTVGGGLIGGSVKFVGEKMGSKWVEEVGEGIEKASVVALDNAGQFIDGAVKGTYGLVTKDEFYQQEGLDDLKHSTSRTAKGIGTTLKYTAENAGTVYKGMSTGNHDQAWEGVKNIGKVAAVTTFAVGVLDFVEGADEAHASEMPVKETPNVTVDQSVHPGNVAVLQDTATEETPIRNTHLGGSEHPETGVPFETKTVDLPNGEVTGSFPVFDSFHNVILPEDMYLQSDSVHFSYANLDLYEAIQENPSIAREIGLTPSEIVQLGEGQTPEGFTWHHSEEPGLLQLVEEDEHHNTGHTGGRELWGGGSEFR